MRISAWSSDVCSAVLILKGVRGSAPIDREALGNIIQKVSQLVSDFPEIVEMDLNPVFATPSGAIAADVRLVVDFAPKPARHRPSQEQMVTQVNRRSEEPRGGKECVSKCRSPWA